ncbi:MAG: class F sortase [Actinomycetia bacterium]|nr:class F sortase [Actinomycetes bacterium]
MVRRLGSLVLAAVLILGGGLLLREYLAPSLTTTPDGTPAPAQDLHLPADEARDRARAAADSATSDAVATRAVTMHVAVPSVGIDAPILSEGIDDNLMTLPDDPSEVGWLDSTAALSDPQGSTLVAGHVSWGGQHGAMYELGRSEPGELVHTWDGDGTLSTWVITDVQMFHKEQLPEEIFQPSGQRSLALVTCGGQLIQLSQTRWVHESNIVVRAVPVVAS